MRTLYVGIGVIAILIGLVWTLQGANVIMGSVMSGSSFWLAFGVVLLVVGVGALILGVRSPGAKKAA
jgi:hypothetical protein